jgi:hypothetical protein
MANLEVGRSCNPKYHHKFIEDRIKDPTSFEVDGIYIGMLSLYNGAFIKPARFHGHALLEKSGRQLRFGFDDNFTDDLAAVEGGLYDGFMYPAYEIQIRQQPDVSYTLHARHVYFLEYDQEAYKHSQQF